MAKRRPVYTALLALTGTLARGAVSVQLLTDAEEEGGELLPVYTPISKVVRCEHR